MITPSLPAVCGLKHGVSGGSLYPSTSGSFLVSAEVKRYYRGQVNEVRGDDTVARLSLKLQQAYRTLSFKAFLMGHPGVGKSTEVSRLLERVKSQHVGVRLSIATELNPASFKVVEVLLLMLVRLAEEADRMQAVPLEGVLSEHLVSGIEQWFG